MNHSWPALTTCTVCLLCAAVQIYWGGQDQQGQFHPEYLSANGNLGMSLFFLGPYALLAVSSLIAWRQRAARRLLALVVVFCAVGVLAGWIDHDQHLRTPPGRGTPQLLNFVATLGLWPGSVVVLVAAARFRFQYNQSPTSL